MVSILIPTHNYDAHELVETLLCRVRAEEVEAEIIVGDDGSTSHTEWMDRLFRQEPSRVTARTLKGYRPNPQGLPPEPLRVPDTPLRLLRSEVNVGRSAIRNLLADAACGEWLLFMDCDAVVPPEFSLRRYLHATQAATSPSATAHDVVCGVLRTPGSCPPLGCELRWLYEQASQRAFAADRLNRRAKVPFRTFCFLIRRDLFLRIRFDESIRGYGYEDVLFGIRLERAGHRPFYIDVPLINGDIEPNEVYLAKTEEAIRTLHAIPGGLQGYSALENTAQDIRRQHLAPAVRSLFRLLRRPLRRNLLGPHPRLAAFAFYKLGYYLALGPAPGGTSAAT